MAAVVEDYSILINDTRLGMSAKVGDMKIFFHMDYFKSFNVTTASGGIGILKLYHQQPGYFKVLGRNVLQKEHGLLMIELGPLEGVVCGDGFKFNGTTPIAVMACRANLKTKLENIQIDLTDDQAVVLTIPA